MKSLASVAARTLTSAWRSFGWNVHLIVTLGASRENLLLLP